MARTPYTVALLLCLSARLPVAACQKQQATYPHIDSWTALDHETEPHRGTIPVAGLDQAQYMGEHRLALKLTVSPTGDVLHAEPSGDDEDTRFWPQVEGKVFQWKFTPFLRAGRAVTAEVDESVVLVPPERLPTKHVAPPPVRQDSQIAITLRREWCDGTCDLYTVTVSGGGTVFQGVHGVADGEHTARLDRQTLLALARRFTAADFYSMEDSYRGSLNLFKSSVSITIDGHRKSVTDCVGQWAGMPAVILQLEDEVDAAARTDRWTRGAEGLVLALREEKFRFATYPAQQILESAAVAGQTATVRELLAAGVPIQPLPAPKEDNPNGAPFAEVQLLTAASAHPTTLQVLLQSGVSRDDQKDKDLALDFAARAGKLDSVRALIAYGADPLAALGSTRLATVDPNVIVGQVGPGSILIDAARSGNPAVVREILHYGPALETRDREGETALLVAAASTTGEDEDSPVMCVRLLAEAGARVDARDSDGNTPLHRSSLLGVEEELLQRGADVNARNNGGETPIFTAKDVRAIPLFLRYGADLSIRNNRGETALASWRGDGPAWHEALESAMSGTEPRH